MLTWPMTSAMSEKRNAGGTNDGISGGTAGTRFLSKMPDARSISTLWSALKTSSSLNLRDS